MSSNYRVLPVIPLDKSVSYVTPRQPVVEWVTADQPALMVMTDFSVVTAFIIAPLENIEAARTKMIHHGVRLLLVTDEQNQILGLVTAFDLTSERPMQIIQTQGIRHDEVLVKDIMTPRERLEVLRLEDLQKATVGDVVKTLQTQGRQHALVVERQGEGGQVLRGMLSSTQIGRQLGTTIETTAVASSFAEIRSHLHD